MSERGLFVAIEGGDGSGKGTQSEMLLAYLKNELGVAAVKFSFPRYGEPSARYAGRYLDGRYGSADQVHPELGVLPYAIDRFAASVDIRTHIDQPHSVAVADRYMASNLAHQGAKIIDPAERKIFYEETMSLEYDILGIPKPDINLVLSVPSTIAQANIDKKDAKTRTYTKKKRDIHEADAGHLDLATANYEELCVLYPDMFRLVNSMSENGSQRSLEGIHKDIVKIVKSLL